jgi:hypothetical protein
VRSETRSILATSAFFRKAGAKISFIVKTEERQTKLPN